MSRRVWPGSGRRRSPAQGAQSIFGVASQTGLGRAAGGAGLEHFILPRCAVMRRAILTRSLRVFLHAGDETGHAFARRRFPVAMGGMPTRGQDSFSKGPAHAALDRRDLPPACRIDRRIPGWPAPGRQSWAGRIRCSSRGIAAIAKYRSSRGTSARRGHAREPGAI